MKANNSSEWVVAFCLAAILILAGISPRWSFAERLWTTRFPSLAAGLFLFWALVWKEGVRDEWENLHRLAVGRFGFLVGGGILLLLIFYQLTDERLDPVLILALSAMVLAKTLAVIYQRRKH